MWCIDLNLDIFLTFVGTIFTVTLAYIGITTKIKKDRKAKWIEDFRNHIWSFASSAMLYSSNGKNSNEDLIKIVQHATLILLYLDNKKKNHKELEMLISSVASSITVDSNSEQLRNYPTQFKSIIELARKIIIDEETAIR